MTNSKSAAVEQLNDSAVAPVSVVKPTSSLVYVHHDEDLHTIIAALRFWQRSGMGDPFNRDDEMQELATNGGEVTSLCDEDIDALVEHINVDHDPVAFRALLESL